MSNKFYGLTDNMNIENHDTASSDESSSYDTFLDNYNNMTGGAEKIKKIPNGGFPPIIYCVNEENSDNDDMTQKDKKKRNYSNKQQKLSIHKILDESTKTPIFKFN